ncbi:hypothetical protein HZA55_09735 [Candidatus Poribacteria bacterium]|nr:hypothetical protein [Candidatus Poribacteria bacterium]
MKLSEKKELLYFSKSSSLKKDMNYLSLNKYNPIFVNGKADMDKFIDFLTQYNEFINHKPKLFRPIIDNDMKL